MFSVFDPFYFPTTRVVVVSEERLREAERKAKQTQIDQLSERIEAYEARTREAVAQANKQLEGLRTELAALPPAKEAVAA
jgi:predicted  nucleic acid-binding Zn-ribbon protein